jgi:hypothetical protein
MHGCSRRDRFHTPASRGQTRRSTPKMGMMTKTNCQKWTWVKTKKKTKDQTRKHMNQIKARQIRKKTNRCPNQRRQYQMQNQNQRG